MSSSRHSSEVPEKSNFAQTCNLLSQYVKERGSLRDLNIEIGGRVESLEAIVKPGPCLAASASISMNSLNNNLAKSVQHTSVVQPPSVEPNLGLARPDSTTIMAEDASNETGTSNSSKFLLFPTDFIKEGGTAERKPAQLTIFYSGKVLVFDDYPAYKVRELVSIAKKGCSQMSYGILSNTIQEKANPIAREGLPPWPQPSPGKQPVDISSNTCREKTNPPPTGAVVSNSSAREGLPPRPQLGSGKQTPGISSHTCKEKTNPAGSPAVASTSSPWEGLPPLPQTASGKLSDLISLNTCKETTNPTTGGAAATSSKAVQDPSSPQSEANGSDLPIARRSSLHRFLEKRKDRAAGREPYQNQEQHASSSSSSKGDGQLDLNL